MADVDLTITIPDEHVSRVLTAIDVCAGKTMYYYAEGYVTKHWSYDPKDGGETNIEYGQRVLRTLLRELVRTYELNADVSRYKGDVDSLTLPAENVPDGVVT